MTIRISMVGIALLFLTICASAVQAATVKGELVAKDVSNSFFSGTLISLNFGEKEEFVSEDGSFEIHDVSPGVYALNVVTTSHQFPNYRIEVKSNGSVRGLEVSGNKKTAIRYPLTLQAIGRPAYFEKRQQMSLYSMFANPMGIMMLVTLGIVVVFPKMMDSLDPEEMKKIQEEMEGKQKPSELLQGILGTKATDAEDSD